MELAIIILIGVTVVAYVVTVIHAATARMLAEHEHGERPETRLLTWPKWMLGLLAALVALWLLFHVRGILAPFVLGGLIAYMLDPIVDRLVDRGVARNRAIWSIFVLLLLLLALAAVLLIPAIASEARTLVDHYDDYAKGARDFVAGAERLAVKWGGRVGLVREDVRRAAAQVGAHAQAWGLGLLRAGLGWLNRSLSLLMLLVVTPVVAFWLLRDYHSLGRLLLRPVPEAHRQSTVEITRDVNRIVGGYLLGILTMSALVAVYSSVVLTLLGVRFSILLGAMTGVLSIIPYFGFPTAMVIIGLTMAATGKGIVLILVAIGLHILGNLASDNLLYPRVVGGRVGLHPLVVIFSLLAGGVLLNFVGVVLAVPIAGVAKMLLHRFWPDLFTTEEAGPVVRP